MKSETQAKLKFAVAEVMRSVLASDWFWERLPRTRSASVRKERSKLQRAAVKAQGDPLRFVEDLGPLGPTFFATDSNLRESAAIAAIAVYEAIAECIQSPEAMTMQSEHFVSVMRDYFVSLASRPGRPQQNMYREAAAFVAKHGKTPPDQLCESFYPDYRSMDPKQREQAHKRMYAGVHRVLKRGAIQTTKYPT